MGLSCCCALTFYSRACRARPRPVLTVNRTEVSTGLWTHSANRTGPSDSCGVSVVVGALFFFRRSARAVPPWPFARPIIQRGGAHHVVLSFVRALVLSIVLSILSACLTLSALIQSGVRLCRSEILRPGHRMALLALWEVFGIAGKTRANSR